MILSLRPGCSVSIPAFVPQRRRVIVIGATEAGVSAAVHLGATAMLIEQRSISEGAPPDDANAERVALYEAALDTDTLSGIKRWRPPELTEAPTAQDDWDSLHLQLMSLTSGEVRLGTRVTAIDSRDRRLHVSTGESFIYDKLVSTVKLAELRRLIADEQPDHVRGVEWWHYWLSMRDIEHIDSTTQQFSGDLDGVCAGKRVADFVRGSLWARYSSASVLSRRPDPLFQPRLVSNP